MDQNTDLSGRHLLRLDTLTTVPDYVKTASVDTESMAGIAEHLFADPVRREFPCDNPGHTFLSYAYCLSANTGSSLVRDRIKAAATRHGITADLAVLDTVFEGLEKQAKSKPAASFAITIDFGKGDNTATHPLIKQGGMHGFYPINTPEEIVASAVQLGNDRDRIPLGVFAEGCTTIVKAAHAAQLHNHELPRTICDYGLERLPNYEYVEHEAAKRARITGDAIYAEIASKAASDATRPRQDYIDLWKQADDLNDVVYSRDVPDPFLIFNSGVLKSAHDAELNKWALIEGAAIPRSVLAGLTDGFITKHFSKAAAAKVLALSKVAADGEDLDPAVSAIAPSARKHLLKLLTR